MENTNKFFFVSLQKNIMSKILVTGGAGFIGSHTVVELQNSGFEVVIADDLSNSNENVIQQIAEITQKKPIFELVNLANEEVCKQLFTKHSDITAVIHFAASKAVGESVEKPLFYYKNNLCSLLNVLENMVQHNIKPIVFSSSCTVYGQPKTLPVNEQCPLQPAESPYGNSKQIAEEILSDCTKATSIKVISLRYFNPIGAHEAAMIGELPIGVPNNLMPFITQTAAGIREKLSVFGNDYNTPDGTCIRDYIHVVDLAKAHVVALNRMLKNQQKKSIEFFNVGTGKGFSVLEVIKSFEKTSGQKLNYQIVGRRAGDIEQIWADPKFANEELGWKAEKTLDEMTLSAWNWQKKLSKIA
jgi:UDP-glucose 4-epimerase